MPTFPAGRGITRFELENSNRHGFMVRICREGKKINEFFSDQRCGGKRKAKKMAEERYQELCEQLGPANLRATKNLITKRNSTGAVGVHVARSLDTRWTNSEYTSYCASWITPEGERQKISFSWNKHGKAAAFELACLARKIESNDRAELLKIYERRVARRKTAKKATPKKAAVRKRS